MPLLAVALGIITGEIKVMEDGASEREREREREREKKKKKKALLLHWQKLQRER